jgi:hypothetical protein
MKSALQKFADKIIVSIDREIAVENFDKAIFICSLGMVLNSFLKLFNINLK